MSKQGEFCCIRMSEAVEGAVLQVGILENLLVEFRYGVGVVHLADGWGWKHVLIVRVFAVFLGQEVHRFLGDGDPADRGLERF